MLACFIRRSGDDASRPARHGLWACIFRHYLIWGGLESRRVIYGDDYDMERLRSRSATPPVCDSAVIVQSERNCGGAVEIDGWCVAESAIDCHRGLAGKELGMIGA